MRKLLKLLYWVFLFLVVTIVLINVWMATAYRAHTYETLKEVDQGYDVALTLGTSRWTRSGSQNKFFSGRIEAASRLYHAEVVKHLLLSGDNSLREYNEPIELQRALMDQDVHHEDMTLDYAGFRTLDSIVRARAIFGADSIIVVSQRYHLPRALFIARSRGIEAIGFVARGPDSVPLKLYLREILARPMAFVEVFVLNKQPKFLGEKEPIQIRRRSTQ